jgi:hypothetical protein
MGYIYLASPYSAPTLQERVNRFMAAQDGATWLIKNGFAVYSPIVHWHHISLIEELPEDFEFWRRQNDELLDGCSEIVVMIMPGCKESKGIRYELERARKADKQCSTFIGSWTSRHETIKYTHELVPMEFKSWTPDSVLAQ